MNISRVRSLSLLAACVALTILGAACGSKAVAPSTPTGSSAATTTPAASPTSPPSATATAPGQPSIGTVPAGFKATSVTFVSPSEAFVLGTASGQGTLVVHTLDRGRTWSRLNAPAVPLGRPLFGKAHAAWGIRFASPAHGFIFGRGLWETTDGGLRWTAAAAPAGQILSLATIDGEVMALVAKSDASANLLRRPLAGGTWSEISAVKADVYPDPTDLISTQAGTAAVLDGTTVLVTTNGGVTVARRATPSVPGYEPGWIGATSSHTLALLLVGQGYTGHTDKRVATSSDLGRHWRIVGKPPSEGDAGVLAGGTPTSLILATASAASWLDRSVDSGVTWKTQATYDDGGVGWADLGFTTAKDAVVVHGPADTAGNSYGRPGQLILSSDGGATWRAVTF